MSHGGVLLTVGGSDPSAGAGIQADIKTFEVMGVYGASVITSVTVQNTASFIRRYDLPPDLIRSQIRAIMEDMDVRLAKVGMLGGSDVIKLVAEELSGFRVPFILDPVIRSSTGGVLLDTDALETLKTELLPHAYLVTPNIPEAEMLTGIEIRAVEDERAAAIAIKKIGAENVIITGGHLEGADLLLDQDGRFSTIGGELGLIEGDWHGTGCTYTAALAANLATGKSLIDAANAAKRFVVDAMRFAHPVGKGLIPLNHAGRLIRDRDRYLVLEDVKAAVDEVLRPNFVPFLPEVGSNIAVAIPGAATRDDVAAVSGRIVRCGNRAVQVGPVEFGASDHIARVILAMMRFDPSMRACCNVRYSDEIIRACSDIGLEMAEFVREDEPEGERTMDWGVRSVIERLGHVPDVIYDLGGMGKEPMIRITGKEGKDLVSKVVKLIDALES